MRSPLLLLSALAGLLLAAPPSARAQETPPAAYTLDGYAALQSAMDEADIGLAATAPDTPERVAAVELAIETRRETLRYISGWIASGTMDPAMVESASTARRILIENMVQLNLRLDHCDEVDTLITLIGELGEDEAFQAAYRDAVEGAERCHARVGTLEPEPEDATVADGAQGDETPVDDPEGDTSDSPGPSELSSPAPVVEPAPAWPSWALIAVGGVAMAGSAGWNVALLDERSEYLDLRDAVSAGDASDYERFESLRTTLRDAKTPIAILGVGGAVLTTIGVVGLVRRGHAEPSPVQVTLTGDRVGVQLELLGGASW